MIDYLNSLAKYIFKEFVSIIFYFCGGVYLIKFFLKKKYVLIILNYHNFSKYNNYRLRRGKIGETGFKRNFENQILFFKKHFNFCYPEDFFNNKSPRGINILLTFDDGYRDNYEIAASILNEHNASTIFFLTTNYINSENWLFHDRVRYLVSNGILNPVNAEHHLLKMNKGKAINSHFKKFVDENFSKFFPGRIMMNWDEVMLIKEMAFKLGSHTCNHSVLKELSCYQQLIEIRDSRKDIEFNTKSQCNHLAYPNGLYNDDTLKILDFLHIEFGYTTVPGVNKVNTPRKALKRIGVNASDKVNVLLLKILISLMNDES